MIENTGTFNTDHFAPRLRAAMSWRGMSQAELARKAGVTECLVSTHANGKNLPTLNTCVLYAQAMNVSLDWLAGREEW